MHLHPLLICTLFSLWMMCTCASVKDSNHKLDDGDEDIPLDAPHLGEDGEHDDEYDHEAVLGSRKDAQKFKDLEPEEAKKKLGDLVDKMDTDKDGIITKEELNDWIVNSMKKLDLESAEERVEEHDTEQDHMVSFPEILAKSYSASEEELKKWEHDSDPDMKHNYQLAMEDRERFELADINKDGKLNVSEYAMYMHPHNYQHMAPVEVAQTIALYDTDKDGVIGLSEYLGNDTNNATLLNDTKYFKDHDKNGDGFLDKDEVALWVMAGFTHVAAEETDHLMKETDTNKDGKLSKDEIVEHHKLWVGSHATDYGRHLDGEL